MIGVDGGMPLYCPVLVTLPVGSCTKPKDNSEALSDDDEQAGREITAVNFDVAISSPEFLNSMNIGNCINLIQNWSLLLIHVLTLALTVVFNMEDKMTIVTVAILQS